MSSITTAAKTLAPAGSNEYIVVQRSTGTATEAIAHEPKTIRHQQSSSSDERSWDFASAKSSREQIPAAEPTTTAVQCVETEAKDGGSNADTHSSTGGDHDPVNSPPRHGLRTVRKYTNLRAKIPRETKLVAGLPVIWAKTGDPKHDLQLFDRVYLGKEDPNKTSF
ncbi:hypothetical protein TWF730_001501 [Orbilia blumenaviensis]|uniref:Uncharacterized protein n=1 Tax=Orbilia blumenaviensis TaxID=1796055 RepID=A0AAV9UKZ4_9PEZI